MFNSQINEQIIKYRNKIENLKQQSLILDNKLINLKNEVDNYSPTIGINSIIYYCSFDFNIIKGRLIGMAGRINSNGTLQNGFRYIIEDELFDSLNVPAEQVFSTEKKPSNIPLLKII